MPTRASATIRHRSTDNAQMMSQPAEKKPKISTPFTELKIRLRDSPPCINTNGVWEEGSPLATCSPEWARLLNASRKHDSVGTLELIVGLLRSTLPPRCSSEDEETLQRQCLAVVSLVTLAAGDEQLAGPICGHLSQHLSTCVACFDNENNEEVYEVAYAAMRLSRASLPKLIGAAERVRRVCASAFSLPAIDPQGWQLPRKAVDSVLAFAHPSSQSLSLTALRAVIRIVQLSYYENRSVMVYESFPIIAKIAAASPVAVMSELIMLLSNVDTCEDDDGYLEYTVEAAMEGIAAAVSTSPSKCPILVLAALERAIEFSNNNDMEFGEAIPKAAQAIAKATKAHFPSRVGRLKAVLEKMEEQ